MPSSVGRSRTGRTRRTTPGKSTAGSPAAHTTAVRTAGNAAAAARAQGTVSVRPLVAALRCARTSTSTSTSTNLLPLRRAPRRGIGFACREKASKGTARRHANCPPPFPSLPFPSFAHCPLRLRCLLPPRRLPVVPDPDGGSHVPPRHLSAGSAHREWAGSSCPSFCLLFPCCALQDCRSSASSPVAVPNQTTTVTTAVGCGCAWHCLCWKHSSVSDRSVKKITLLLMIQQSNSSYQHQTNSSLQ